MPDTLGFRLRFYQAAASDLLRFLHGRYGGPISFRPRDAARIEKLRSGPSLFLTAHFHHWEHMGAWMTRQGIPLLSGARPMANPLSQSLLVRLRERMGMAVVFHDIPRQALRHLNQGGCFGFLWDQRVASPEPGSPPAGLAGSVGSKGSIGSTDKEMGLFGSPGLTTATIAPSPMKSRSRRTKEESTIEGFSDFADTHPPRSRVEGSASEIALRPSFRPRPRADLFGRALSLDPLPHFLTRHVPLPVFFGVLLPGGRFRVFQIADPGREETSTRSSDPYRNLGRRYHRILECLVRAYPAYWYGLAHGRFQGSEGSE